jgi:hypothetical protein
MPQKVTLLVFVRRVGNATKAEDSSSSELPPRAESHSTMHSAMHAAVVVQASVHLCCFHLKMGWVVWPKDEPVTFQGWVFYGVQSTKAGWGGPTVATTGGTVAPVDSPC